MSAGGRYISGLAPMFGSQEWRPTGLDDVVLWFEHVINSINRADADTFSPLDWAMYYQRLRFRIESFAGGASA